MGTLPVPTTLRASLPWKDSPEPISSLPAMVQPNTQGSDCDVSRPGWATWDRSLSFRAQVPSSVKWPWHLPHSAFVTIQ